MKPKKFHLRNSTLHADPEKVKAWRDRTRKPLPKTGKRAMLRAAMNARLNRLGIHQCELRLPGCWGNNGLTWAHAQKSRFLVTDADWLEACRACVCCHNFIEKLSHDEMKRAVTDAIRKRLPSVPIYFKQHRFERPSELFKRKPAKSTSCQKTSSKLTNPSNPTAPLW